MVSEGWWGLDPGPERFGEEEQGLGTTSVSVGLGRRWHWRGCMPVTMMHLPGSARQCPALHSVTSHPP